MNNNIIVINRLCTEHLCSLFSLMHVCDAIIKDELLI